MPSTLGHATQHTTLEALCLGEVDIETHTLSQGLTQYPLSPLLHDLNVGREITLFLVGTQAVTYGRNTLHASLEHSPHRAAIMYGYRGIVAVVDTADHQVGSARHELFKCNLDAVYRGARAGIDVV